MILVFILFSFVSLSQAYFCFKEFHEDEKSVLQLTPGETIDKCLSFGMTTLVGGSTIFDSNLPETFISGNKMYLRNLTRYDIVRIRVLDNEIQKIHIN